MKTIRNIITIKKDLCEGCGVCVDTCSNFGFHIIAIQIVDEKCELTHEAQCYGRGDCVDGCPAQALFIEKRSSDLIKKPDALGF